jgi:hypothetical protein
MGGCTRAVYGQWLGKNVPAAKNRRERIEVLLETGCFWVVQAEELWGRQLGHPVPRGYKYGDLGSGLEESRIWDSKMWSWVQRDSDLRMNALARPSSNFKWHNASSHQKGCYIRTIYADAQLKNILALSLKVLGVKTNWFAVNRQS